MVEHHIELIKNDSLEHHDQNPILTKPVAKTISPAKINALKARRAVEDLIEGKNYHDLYDDFEDK